MTSRPGAKSKYDFDGFEDGEVRFLPYASVRVQAALCMWKKRKNNGWEFITCKTPSGIKIMRTK